ncbi:MAG TPA: pyridoxal phosphate-dependent aminotransferase [Bryobacteraceae bacterium]|nr:pyridoxal phosphate-dependent aminotransferase [Bryobacteraceae bacterium]
MFSRRLQVGGPVNRIAAALAARTEPHLDLTVSNPTAAGIEYDAAAITRALADARSLRYEPEAFGLRSAREAIAAHCGAESERVILTASTSEAYSFLFKLLCDPGDEVLAPRPSYPLFEYLAQLESVQVLQYRLFYDHGWHIDWHDLRERVSNRTRAIITVNPNNPTGSYLRRGDLDQFAELGIPVISDEVFLPYELTAEPERVCTAGNEHRVLTFALSGLSKLAGLPQLKLAWIIANGPAGARADALARLELIADTYLSVGTPVQLAAPVLLDTSGCVRAQIRERSRRNLQRLQPLRPLLVEGGWYGIVQAPRTRSEEEWVLTLLAREGVLVQPGFFYDFEREAFLIVSLLTPEDVFSEGIERLASAIT